MNCSPLPDRRWTSASGSYEVIVARNGDVVARSGRIASTSWTPPLPLARDARYEWQITVEQGGRRWNVPPPEEHRPRFRILSDEEARQLAAVRASGDPLAIGIVAARLGAVDEALARLGASSDPRARALAKKIRAW